MRRLIWLVVAVAAWPIAAGAAEHVVLERDGREIEISGRLLVTAEDGGMLILAADGKLWSAPPEEIVKHASDDELMQPLSQAELGELLLKELPPGFEIHATQHYLICHNTSRAYAQWCGALFERLYKAFTNFWSRKGFDLDEPEFPLVALVFADRDSYSQFVDKELAGGASSIVAYYSLQTNRMSMHDLTGVEALRRGGDKRGSSAEINRMLARPEAELMVATVIHEATHQIAFNCGFQARYAAIPVWVSEGLAIYFETPDLASSKGWRTIGAVNRVRLARFRESLRRRPADSLTTLIAGDQRLRNGAADDRIDGYAEAWALNYFLFQKHPKQYVSYLKQLSKKEPLIQDTPAERLQEFKQAFGDLEQLDAEFLRYISKVR
ncbi:MAG TPA: DUF1570 domain-containing protein [Pirellulales bacterium]|nr:DUF1570 domain-containing protein [Pirellulales bacterium]